MLSRRDLTSKARITKDIVADQTWTHLQKKLDNSNIVLNATEGVGEANSNSWVVLGSMGGFDDQRVTVNMKWVAPTTAGNEEIGAMVRCTSFESPNQSYYYARVDGGVAKLTKVVNSAAFANLSTSVFALPINTICTITLEAVGSLITATFTAAGVAQSPLVLQATDSDIAGGGLMGFRTLACAGWCSFLEMEQL